MNLKSARGNLIPNVSLTGNIFSNYNLTDRNFDGSHIAEAKYDLYFKYKLIELLLNVQGE